VLDEEECSAGELELGRFKLKEGARLGQEVRDYGNAQIHRYLDLILAGAGGRGGRPGYLGGGPQRMIVD